MLILYMRSWRSRGGKWVVQEAIIGSELGPLTLHLLLFLFYLATTLPHSLMDSLLPPQLLVHVNVSEIGITLQFF